MTEQQDGQGIAPGSLRVIDISGRVSRALDESLRQATTLAEFMFSYHGIKMQSEGIAWMWDYGEQTEESVLEFFRNDASKKEAARDAKVVEELAPVLQGVTDNQPSTIRVILKRI